MKKLIPYIVLIATVVFFAGCSSAKSDGPKMYEPDISKLFSFGYERPEELDSEQTEQISIIRYVLKNTYENNIHRMRGETDNTVYTNQDGQEAVYDADEKLVTNSYNQGSFNYYFNEDEPIKKFIFDIAPWLLLGNTKDDPTTFEERLYYYTLDLDIGIQSYIFDGSDETLEAVPFDELSKNEKEVYYVFLELLFSEGYEIELSSGNIPRLRDDGEYYFEYFAQVQGMLGFSEEE